MLLYQGVLAFELFTGVKADDSLVEAMRKGLKSQGLFYNFYLISNYIINFQGDKYFLYLQNKVIYQIIKIKKVRHLNLTFLNVISISKLTTSQKENTCFTNIYFSLGNL